MIGRTLAHYRITAAIGAGGMGQVYRATDAKLGREVALKVLPGELAGNAEMIGRFRREARAVAALNHPNIVTIYSVEEMDGVHFLTMELVQGQTLDRLIPAAGLDAARILDIASGLAAALTAAHDRGIIHRDLKPANVMLAEDGSVKVLDFGLAKFEDAGSDLVNPDAATAAMTNAGVVMGTRPYMSPEQVQGRTLDHRTDIFSMGVLLYELSTGRRPFHGTSNADLFASILRDSVPPVSETRSDLPEDLSRVIRRCLEKDPRHRIQTARDIGNELRDASAPVSRSPSATKERAGQAVAIAVLPFSDMSASKDQEYLCESMAEEILTALMRIEGLRVASRTSTFRAHQENSNLPAIARALSVNHVLEGSIRTAGQRLRVTAQLTDVSTGFQVWSERFDRDVTDLFAVQDEIAAGVVFAVRARLAPGALEAVPARTPVHLEAYRHYLQGRHLRYSKNDHKGALRCFEESLALDPSHVPSMLGLAETHVLLAIYSLAPSRESYSKARAAIETVTRLQGETSEALYVLGMIAVCEHEWAVGEASLIRAIEIEPHNVRALCWLGNVVAMRGRIDEARVHLASARAIDPLAPYPYAMSGFVLMIARRAGEALPFIEQALAFDPVYNLALWTSSLAFNAQGRVSEGVAAIERAATPSHRGGLLDGMRGWALAHAGRHEEARTVLTDLQSRPASAPTVVSEGWLLAALGDLDGAFAVFDQAAAEAQQSVTFWGLPPFDDVREDPRFAALMQRLGLSGRSEAPNVMGR